MAAVAGAAAVTLALAGCASAPDTRSTSPADLLAEHDLAGTSAEEIVDRLDRMSLDDRPAELIASVRSDVLLVTDGEQELSLGMPADRTYVSIAPYIEQTHDCFFHSLTTCRGELSGESVEVRIIDDVSGEVLVDETTSTFDNGFVGYWLPRGAEGSIQVSYAGRTGVVPFSTGGEAATCITSLRLV